MARYILAALCFALSLAARAADGPFPGEAAPAAGEHDAAQEIEKHGPCGNVSVESDGHHTRVIDHTNGSTYLLSYFDDGRIARYEGGGATFVVAYGEDSKRPVAVFASPSGREFNLRSGKGPDWYASLRVQGKFPTREKLIERACSQQKTLFEVQDPMLTLMETTDYWIAEMDSSFGFASDFVAMPGQSCQEAAEDCHVQCDQTADIQAISCIALSAIANEMGGAEAAAIVLIACQSASTWQKWNCHANCRVSGC